VVANAHASAVDDSILNGGGAKPEVDWYGVVMANCRADSSACSCSYKHAVIHMHVRVLIIFISPVYGSKKRILMTRMWANAQRDGRPVEYKWRPLFNAAKFA